MSAARLQTSTKESRRRGMPLPRVRDWLRSIGSGSRSRDTDRSARNCFPDLPQCSVPPHDPNDNSLDRDVVLVHIDGLHRLIRWLKSDAAVALAIILLHRS